MDPNLTFATIALVQTVIRYIVARRAGDPNAALAAIQSGNVAAHLTADPDVIRAVAGASSAMAYLEQRGVALKEAYNLITNAQAEDRDVTAAEVQAMLDRTQGALDELGAEIEAKGGSVEGSPAPTQPVAPAPDPAAQPAGSEPAATGNDGTPPENQ